MPVHGFLNVHVLQPARGLMTPTLFVLYLSVSPKQCMNQTVFLFSKTNPPFPSALPVLTKSKSLDSSHSSAWTLSAGWSMSCMVSRIIQYIVIIDLASSQETNRGQIVLVVLVCISCVDSNQWYILSRVFVLFRGSGLSTTSPPAINLPMLWFANLLAQVNDF